MYVLIFIADNDMHVCPLDFESLVTEDEKVADEGNMNFKAHTDDKEDTESNDYDNNIEYRI